MNELDRDARTLVARVRKRDGPTAEDRARLRQRLESAWAAQRVDEAATRVDAVAIASTRGLPSTAAAMLIVSLGFLSPESPRVVEPERPVSAAAAPRSAAAAPAVRSGERPPMAAGEAPESGERAVGTPRSGERAAATPAAAALGANDASRAPVKAAGVRRDDQREPQVAANSAALSLAPSAASRASSREAGPPRARMREARPSRARTREAAPSRARMREAGPSRARMREAGPPRARMREARASRASSRESEARARASALEARSAATPSPAEPRTNAGERDRAGHDAAPAALVRDEPVSDVAPTVSDRGFTPQAIDDELAWLGAAQDALRKGRPSRALSLVQQHAFRFPRGALAPERSAVQALALCALQRKEAARVVLADLARRTPSSPLLDRVRRTCGL